MSIQEAVANLGPTLAEKQVFTGEPGETRYMRVDFLLNLLNDTRSDIALAGILGVVPATVAVASCDTLLSVTETIEALDSTQG